MTDTYVVGDGISVIIETPEDMLARAATAP